MAENNSVFDAVYDNLFACETFDVGRAADLAGWTQAGFDDSAWVPATLTESPNGMAEAQSIPPIRIVEERAIESVEVVAPGVFLFDLGHNLAGWAELAVDAPDGTTIDLTYGERLQGDRLAVAGVGTPTRVLEAGPARGPAQLAMSPQRDRYIASDNGTERWQPRFSYKGSRYVEVRGWPEPGPELDDLTAKVVHTDLRRTGHLESSHPLPNSIFRNMVWAVRSNVHSIPTDTPLYEKTGWTGDAVIAAPTWMYLFDTQALFSKYVKDFADTQGPSGDLEDWAPAIENGGDMRLAPAWDSALWKIPSDIHRMYGDARPLVLHYDALKRYDGLYGMLSAGQLAVGTQGYADWCPPPTCLSDDPTLGRIVKPQHGTAYRYDLTRTLERAAELQNLDDDAAAWNQQAQAIYEAYNDAYFNTTTQNYRRDPRVQDVDYAQYANIISLAFGLVPDDLRQAVADNLAADVSARGDHLNTGVLGTRYLFPMLSNNGHHDRAFAVATQTTYPSYGYWIDTLGFTSLIEDWQAVFRSTNHHFFGTVVQWFFEDLAGIRPLEPGFATFEIVPQIPGSGLDHVSTSYDSLFGPIESTWESTNERFVLEVVVPPDTQAFVSLPSADIEAIDTPEAGVTPVGSNGERARFSVASGSYRFSIDR